MTAPLPLDPETAESLERAAEAIRSASRLDVACHVNPDGDALGSILAMALALGPRTPVTIGWGSAPLEIPSQYGFLPGLDLLQPPDAFGGADVCVALDCASEDRLEALRGPFEAARVLVNVDHHVSNTRFGTIDVVDDSSSSTCELVLHLLLRLEADISPDVATCLYTGLVTDTGRFGYASVGPRTHAVAGFLIDRGVRVDTVSQAVFESQPYAYLKVLGHVLERCRLMDDPPLVVSWVTQQDAREAGISLEETEELINVLRAVRETDAAAILKEQPDGRWKGSLRSKGRTDVSAIAQAFGGGGHRLAAGFTSDLGLEETIDKVHRSLRPAPADA